MGIGFTVVNNGLTRSGSYLDLTQDFTIIGKIDSLTAGPGGGNYKLYWLWGDNNYVNSAFYLTSQLNNDNVFLGHWDGAVEVQSIPVTLTTDRWNNFAIVYKVATTEFEFWLNSVLIDTLIVDLNALGFVEKLEYAGTDIIGSIENVGLEYIGIWQRAFTELELNAQWQTPSIASATNLLSYTPLVSSTDLADTSGHNRNWTLLGAASTITPGSFPLINNMNTVIFQFGSTIDVDSAIFAYDAVTGEIISYGIPPTGNSAALARRLSDNHIFAFISTGVVYEFGSLLNYIQKFGIESSSAPETLFPTNNIWNFHSIVFISNYVILTWTGGHVTNPHTIAAQLRDKTTFALITQILDFEPSITGQYPQCDGISPDGTKLYTYNIGGSIANQNIVYEYTILTAATVARCTYGTWNGGANTGWMVRGYDIASNGNIVVLYHHFTAFVRDDAHCVVFTPAGGVFLDIPLLFANAPDDPPDILGIDHVKNSVWFTNSTSTPDIFQEYSLIDGALVSQFPSLIDNDGNNLVIISSGGSIIVIKLTTPPADTPFFDFSINGGLSPGAFSLRDSISTGDVQVFNNVPPGTYELIEDSIPGYDVNGETSNGSPIDAITVADGEEVTVWVTNRGQSGQPNNYGGIYILKRGKTNDTVYTTISGPPNTVPDTIETSVLKIPDPFADIPVPASDENG